MNEFAAPALRLLEYLTKKHWTGQALSGPDPIGKINWRVTRFVKGYTRWLPWPDQFVYSQSQGYWIKAQARLQASELPHPAQPAAPLGLIRAAADELVGRQLPGGAWEHPPLRERRGFVSTVETVWACLGLVTAYQKTNDPAYLQALQKGYAGLNQAIGYQKIEMGGREALAVNYHAHTKNAIPNVTIMLLWLKAALAKVSGDAGMLDQQEEMLNFLELSQAESGEMPYVYQEELHFQCYQYNSFEFLDLANYYLLTGNPRVEGLLSRLAKFLKTGVSQRHSCRYNCSGDNPETLYWNAALAAALWAADQLGLGAYQKTSDLVFERLLSQQKADGSFEFSQRNYVFLSDKRSYPRQQAMILFFLLSRAAGSYTVI